jgi:hypothetical protein
MRLALATVALIAAAAAPLVQAAARLDLLTPQSISVAGGESQNVTVQVFDALGRPSAGESVRFANDACGRFQDGQFFTTVVSNATGLATVRFTASIPPGITCWIQIAADGVGITVVDVLTYSVNGVRMETSMSPPNPRPGQSYVLTVQPTYGIYGLRDVEVTANVVNGTGTASLSRTSAFTQHLGYAEFEVYPSATGEYAIDVGFRTRKSRVVMGGPEKTWQDLWWVGTAENGWGMSIVQHGEGLFAVIYAYDDTGKPTWYVIPGGTWNAAHTEFTGAAYVPTGSPFYSYDTAHFLMGPPVGNVKLAFTDPDHATLDYTLAGKSARKMLQRNLFGPQDLASVHVGDMWWGGSAQGGWGIAVLQQYRTLFTVWFTYDANGAPTWYVMPSGTWSDSATYEGRVFRATSGPWLGATYDASKFKTTDVGSFKLRVAGDTATFDYSVEGRSGSIPLMRFPF